MSEIDKQIIEKRLDSILKYCLELDTLLGFSNDEIKNDTLKGHTLERLVQLIVDEMIDVNEYIIKVYNLPVPDDFQSTFLTLSRHNIFNEEFARQIAPVVGLRNRIVHRYEEIDLDLLIDTARKEKDDFKKFVSFVVQFIK